MTTQKPMAIPRSKWREQEAQADKMQRSVKLAAAALCIIGAASYWQDIASAISIQKPSATQEVNAMPASSHRLDIGAPQIKSFPAIKTNANGAPKATTDGISGNTSANGEKTMAESTVSSNMGFHRNSKAYQANPKLDYALMTDPGAQKAVATMISDTYKVSYSIAAVSVRASVESAKKHQVDPTLLLALVGQESGFDKAAKNPSGALGAVQVIPKWHAASMKKVGVTNILKAPMEKQIELGAVVLKEFLGPGKGKPVEDALQNYNRGASSPKDDTYKYANGVISKRNALKVILTQYVQEHSPVYASLSPNL